MPKVKICGVQRVEDALTAVEAGADFIGLNFVPNRRRRVSVEQAHRMVDAVKSTSDNPPKLVGLFADQPLEEVRETVRGSGVDMVQLCGAESMEFCEKVSVQVFKAVHVPEGPQSAEELEILQRRLAACGRKDIWRPWTDWLRVCRGAPARPSIGRWRPNFRRRGSSSCWLAD